MMRILLALVLLASPLAAQTDTAPPDPTPISSIYRYATRAQWIKHLDLYYVAMGVDTMTVRVPRDSVVIRDSVRIRDSVVIRDSVRVTPLPPPVVITPPAPPVSADACNAAPWHWQTLADGTRKRDDTMTGQCRAIVTLTDAGRYAVAYAPCGLGQWTYHPTLYVTRASAVLRAKNPPACSGAP